MSSIWIDLIIENSSWQNVTASLYMKGQKLTYSKLSLLYSFNLCWILQYQTQKMAVKDEEEKKKKNTISLNAISFSVLRWYQYNLCVYKVILYEHLIYS